MNAENRKVLATVSNEIADLIATLERERDAEQDKFDNMPEGFQEGEKGQAMEQCVSDLDDAINSLEEARGALDNLLGM